MFDGCKVNGEAKFNDKNELEQMTRMNVAMGHENIDDGTRVVMIIM